MMKRTLIVLALLVILGTVVFVQPVAAGLDLFSNGAQITRTHGETTYVFTITDPQIATGDGIGIDVFVFSTECIQSGSFTEKNVNITSDAAGIAKWDSAVSDVDLDGTNDTLTLTKQCVDPAAVGDCGVTSPETVSVTFTGAENRWKNSWDGEYSHDLDPLSWFAQRNDADGGTADFTFSIHTPVAPTVTLAETNPDGTVITLTFSKPMADPTGKEGEFNYTIGSGGNQPFRAAALNMTDNHKIDLKIDGPAIAANDAVNVTYTEVKGIVNATDDSVLETFFTPQPVTNNVPAPLTFSSAATNADGTKVLVNFNKDVAAPLPPAPAGFTVTVNAADNVVSAVALNADKKIIELTLTTPVAAGADIVAVTYVPGTIKAEDNGVLAGFGPSAVTNNFHVAAPNVTGISPARGPLAGGTVVNVTGTGFTGATAVKFGNTAGTALTVNSDTQINITSPAGAAGTVNVTVTTPGGTSANSSANQFTYAPAPTVTGIAPTSGTVDGGTVVNVTGTGFTLATAVNFGAKTGTNLTVNSDTQINITSPDGAAGAVVHLTVTTPGGTSTTSDADRFTYAVPPSVTGITPESGINTGLISVNITGTDFGNPPVVKLSRAGQADINATNVVWLSATQISCDFLITGAGTGNWTVIVINPDGQNSLSGPNNPIQLVGLAIANAVSNAPSSVSSTGNSDGAGTGQSSGIVSGGNVVEPAAQGAPSPADPGQTENIYANPNGVITQATSLQSTNGLATLNVDLGVVAKDAAGNPLSSVSIAAVPVESVPDLPSGTSISYAGMAYNLQPDGATFSPAVSISFTVPQGQVAQDYTVRSYDRASGTWQDLPASYNAQTGMVTAEVSHFCLFAVFAKMVTTAPTIAATPIVTPLIPTTLAPPSPTIATNFLGILLWVVNLMVKNPLMLAGIVILAVGIVLMIWKQRRDRLNYRP